MPNKAISKPVIVLVEGLDYLYLLLKSPLVRNPLFQKHVQLLNFKEGGSTLTQYIGLLLLMRDFDLVSHLGVVCDAEFGYAGMCTSVRDALRQHGFAASERPAEVAGDSPKVAYLVIPHDGSDGCLEHACLSACTKPGLIPCVEKFRDCVGGAQLNANWQAKLMVHALIAGSGNNPALTLGESAETGLWDFAHPGLDAILQFVLTLANDRDMSAVTQL